MKKQKISLFLALVLLLGCLSGCAVQKAAVTAALSNSAMAFSRAAEAVIPEDGFALTEGYAQETEVSFPSTSGPLSLLGGNLGLHIAAATADGSCRESRIELKLGSLSLVSLAARTEGNLCEMTCPLLSRKTVLIDLETLPEDLNEMGLGSLLDGEGAGLTGLTAAAPSPDLVLSEQEEAELFDALKALVKDIDVKGGSAEKRDINGYEKSCHIYNVTVPSADLCRIWDAVAPAALRALGEVSSLPVGEAEEPLNAEALFEDLRAALVSTGDWTMELGICDKLVMSAAAELTGSFRGEEFSLRPRLTIGGGEEYVDDLGMYVEEGDAEDGALEWRSHGDHGARGGAFTDESVLTLGTESGELRSSVRYAPKEDKDNLSLSITAAEDSLSCTGTLRNTPDELSLTGGRIVVEGEEQLELGVESRITAYSELVAPAEETIGLSEMKWSEIYDFLSGILEKIEGLSAFFEPTEM